MRYATTVLAKHGACLETSFPYREDRDYLRLKPSENCFAEAKSFRAASGLPISLTPTDISEVCAAMADGLPVAGSFPIFGSSMNSSHFHRTGRLVLRLGSLDQVAGYHDAMALIGYFDNGYLQANGMLLELGGGCFLARNSWGSQWAPENPLARHCRARGGYALMSYAYLQYCFEAFTVRIGNVNRLLQPITDRIDQSWWTRTRRAVVAVSGNRLAETTG